LFKNKRKMGNHKSSNAGPEGWGVGKQSPGKRADLKRRTKKKKKVRWNVRGRWGGGAGGAGRTGPKGESKGSLEKKKEHLWQRFTVPRKKEAGDGANAWCTGKS